MDTVIIEQKKALLKSLKQTKFIYIVLYTIASIFVLIEFTGIDKYVYYKGASQNYQCV